MKIKIAIYICLFYNLHFIGPTLQYINTINDNNSIMFLSETLCNDVKSLSTRVEYYYFHLFAEGRSNCVLTDITLLSMLCI